MRSFFVLLRTDAYNLHRASISIYKGFINSACQLSASYPANAIKNEAVRCTNFTNDAIHENLHFLRAEYSISTCYTCYSCQLPVYILPLSMQNVQFKIHQIYTATTKSSHACELCDPSLITEANFCLALSLFRSTLGVASYLSPSSNPIFCGRGGGGGGA